MTQRKALAQEFSKHGFTKPMSYYEAKTRLPNRTVKRLIDKMNRGEDITVIGKRGRKPLFTNEFLKEVATGLCAQNMTLRETKKDIIEANIRAIAAGEGTLPEVSKSTIHRYVTNETIMNEVDIGPLSFTQVSVRGPAANSLANKRLRIARRQELEAHIRGGYLVVFVDESHWEVGNVRTRGW